MSRLLCLPRGLPACKSHSSAHWWSLLCLGALWWQPWWWAWAARWPGHHCCACAAALGRLELQWELGWKALGPAEEPMVEQRSPFSLWGTPCQGRGIPEGGNVRNMWPLRGPTLEQPMEGPMLEKFKDCLLWVGPHAGTGEQRFPFSPWGRLWWISCAPGAHGELWCGLCWWWTTAGAPCSSQAGDKERSSLQC